MNSPVVDGVSVPVTTINAPGAGNNLTYTVSTTVPFASNTFFMRDRNSLAWNIVTCTGWGRPPAVASLRLTNCTGVPATNAGANVITTGALQARDCRRIGITGMDIELLTALARLVRVDQGEIGAEAFVDRCRGGVGDAACENERAGCNHRGRVLAAPMYRFRDHVRRHSTPALTSCVPRPSGVVIPLWPAL